MASRNVEQLRSIAPRCGHDLAHWLRYLRKYIRDGVPCLDGEDVAALMASDELGMLQKVSLERAMTPGTPTYEYVVDQNMPARTPKVDRVRRELGLA